MSNAETEAEYEMQLIGDMINAAEEFGLLCEVIRSFHGYASSGLGIENSCSCALSDWDL